jgi:hypothetical protein
MSAASPNPGNLVLLGALGIGAYWFLTRRAIAGPIAAPRAAVGPDAYRAQTAAAAGSLAGQVLSFFGGGQNLHGTVDGRSKTQWDVTPAGSDGPRYNNPSAYVAGGNDGLAINPVYGSPYDFTEYGNASGAYGAWV